jgi:DNA repair protein RecO (recombination protein O)
MLQKTEGIILRTIKYNDTSIIIDAYTSLYGRYSFIASLPKSRHSAIKTSLFQPLALVAIEADFHANGRGMTRIKNAKLSIPFSSIPFDRSKTTIAFFLAEFMLHSLREEAENAPLFEYLRNSILWLDECADNFSNFHLVFMMHLSWFLGFYPNLTGYKKGDYFDLQNSCYTSLHPLSNQFFLQPEEADRINTMMRMNYNNMHLFGMSRAQRNRCIEVLLLYYRIHLPEFPDLKSIEVLREVFD